MSANQTLPYGGLTVHNALIYGKEHPPSKDISQLSPADKILHDINADIERNYQKCLEGKTALEKKLILVAHIMHHAQKAIEILHENWPNEIKEEVEGLNDFLCRVADLIGDIDFEDYIVDKINSNNGYKHKHTP